MLWHTVVGGIDLSYMDPIARRDDRSQQVKDPFASLGGKESFNILKNER
jgi:hypothetical protein